MSKKHPSTEEVEQEQSEAGELKRDRLEGETVPESPEAKASPEAPWMDQAFLDQVRAAGFPGSHYGDEAFLAACWRLTGGAPPS